MHAQPGGKVQEKGAQHTSADHQRPTAGNVKEDKTKATSDYTYYLAKNRVGEGFGTETTLYVKRGSVRLDELVAVGLLEYKERGADLS